MCRLPFWIFLILTSVFNASCKDAVGNGPSDAWNWNNVAEPYCHSCSCLGQAVSSSKFPKIQQILSKKFYVPLSSRGDYHMFHLTAKGVRPPSHTSAASSLCLMQKFSFKTKVLSFKLTGHGSYLSLGTLKFNSGNLSTALLYDIAEYYDPKMMTKPVGKEYEMCLAP